MSTCRVCKQTVASGELCAACAENLGLTPGEPVRRAQPCAKCNHPELIRALVRELTVDTGSPPGRTHMERATVPMAVTYGVQVKTSFWTGEVTEGAAERQAFGVLEMYVCTRCGYTEWYCRDPHNIPIGPEYGTEKLDARGGTPYR